MQSHLQLHKCLAETITNSYAKVPNCQWSFSMGETFTPLNVSGTCEQKESNGGAGPYTWAPQFLVLWQGFAWQFCANFLRLLFVYETSHVSDETRSLLLPFLGALNWQLAKWACHHLVFATITLPVVVVSPWGDCHWNREFSNWQTSRKRLKLFTIFRALLPDC